MRSVLATEVPPNFITTVWGSALESTDMAPKDSPLERGAIDLDPVVVEHRRVAELRQPLRRRRLGAAAARVVARPPAHRRDEHAGARVVGHRDRAARTRRGR